MRHSVTGVIVPARCNSHLCPECSPLHQIVARTAIEQGIRRRAMERMKSGADTIETVVFGTLTEPANATLDLPAFRERWHATVKALRRMWGMTDYAVVIEWQNRGALHPHFFAAVNDQVAEDLADRRSRASYARRMNELRPRMLDLGWGQMVDAVTVPVVEDTKLARYAAKSLAGYATKEAKARFKAAGAHRIRPTRLSYGWVPGGLQGTRERVLASERMLPDRLEGEWIRIPKPRSC